MYKLTEVFDSFGDMWNSDNITYKKFDDINSCHQHIMDTYHIQGESWFYIEYNDGVMYKLIETFDKIY